MNDSPENPLDTEVQYLPGIGPKKAQLLEKLNVRTVRQLLAMLPRDVLDLTNVIPPEQFEENEMCTFRGQVAEVDARLLSGNRSMTTSLIRTDGDYVRCVWFNQPWMKNKLVGEDWGLFSGKPKFKKGRWEISNPRIQWLNLSDEESARVALSNEIKGEVLPRYGLTEGLRMEQLRAFVRAAVEMFVDEIQEFLPETFLKEHKLPTLSGAVRNLHLPKTMEDYEAARHRLIFDDLLEFQTGIAIRKKLWKDDKTAPKLEVNAKIDSRIRKLFPFEFTDGQNGAIKEICSDLNNQHPMHRLLQADVGAGKTVVAVYAMLLAVACGQQAVLMAPTELLAQQHWNTINSILASSQVKRTFLTGRLKASQRQETLEQIQSGEIQIIIGTQAVIQKDVRYSNLGVAIIDEQHKFGVMQRSHFSQGDRSPHVLVMTATPIPRSLCLTQFGDLELTLITDMPPGRQEVVTSILHTDILLKRAWEFIREQIRSGRQMFVVCPRIEDKADGGPASADTVFKWLLKNELGEFRIELIHGQIDRETQTETMDQFREGEIDVLVATTVVEVGVDVPNANLMMIVGAERFGLSQLHQLRGRIGRGKFRGYCFIRSPHGSEESLKRLEIMEQTNDGFEVAEADFDLRGPGDVLGTKQHGQLPLRFADLKRDKKLLEESRKTALKLVDSGAIDQGEFQKFKSRVFARFSNLFNLPGSG